MIAGAGGSIMRATMKSGAAAMGRRTPLGGQSEETASIQMAKHRRIPVIDVFAGPGGLGEGFAALRHKRRSPFRVALSIEKDEAAHATLWLRAFYRLFTARTVPESYYDVLRRDISLDELRARHPRKAKAADADAWRAELGYGGVDQKEVRKRIRSAVGGMRAWVLVGGPPCQAYSIAGRSRNKGNLNYSAEKDVRQKLYVEYLQVLADHWPPVFVMENVKGLLSATVGDQRIFSRMLEDLQSPADALKREGRRGRSRRCHRYRVHSLVRGGLFESDLPDFVIQAELYGIPQTRHRLILLGVRNDLGDIAPGKLETTGPVPASLVLRNLPRLRSGLSRTKDSPEAWAEGVRSALRTRWFAEVGEKAGGQEVLERMHAVLKSLSPFPFDRGDEFLPYEASPDYSKDWFTDPRFEGICNHVTRQHMLSDLHRYLYVACFGEVRSHSPRLRDFPPSLLPDHKNVPRAVDTRHFSDRFRVQIYGAPSTTITCHIAKDGHYFIHPDPEQCRSLTVREAARLQCFPDNYCFLGPRTSQYRQVGNAVPPLLSRQIAEIVHGVLVEAGMAD